jgi:two-component system phosphate regulon sensor histidine kinase PhoR
MLWRIFSFIVCQLGTGLFGWWVADQPGAAGGLLIGALGWFALDSWRGARLLAWLRSGDAAAAPALRGLWGDIADRARRALRRRELEAEASSLRLQELLAAIQASPNGVVLLDRQGRIEWCNQTAAGHFGFDLRRDMLQHVTNLVRDPDFTAYCNGGSFDREVVIAGPGSAPSRPAKLSVQFHPYGEGRRLLLSRDVTAVQQAEAMRRDFVANVSHEIRTPLTVLAGFVETLQNLALSQEDRSRYLGLMAQQAQRMQTLVSDLLTLSRLEGSPLPGLGEWTAMPALMAQCEQEARALGAALGKSHELRFSETAAVEVAGVASELLSAMSNLVSNAVRYTPTGAAIDVQWRVLPDGDGEFSVRDSGPGIAPEHMPRLTERFYRVDRSRSRETGGTGLGLAIAKHVAQRHGAELKIDSTLGAGSTFSIRFPASRLREGIKPGTNARLATEALAGPG